MRLTRAHRLVRATISAAVTVILAVGLALVSTAPAQAAATSAVLCKGYASCASYGMTNHGYAAVNQNMYWRMYGGHNCTNYAAYMMVKAGLKNERPWSNATGNASGWGVGMKKKTNTTPAVGSIAWWTPGSGHVAYVEAVISPTEIIISEDQWGGDFYWRVITKANGNWPKGFIHFKDAASTKVPDYRGKINSTSIWLDSTKKTAALTTVMNPGRTYWVEQSYINTGTADWVGLELATQSPNDHDSALATNWPSPSRAAVQQQAIVSPGQAATFAFPITIPAGLKDGTQVVEKFAPVLAGTNKRVSYSSSTLSVTADSRSIFVTQPVPSVSGTLVEGSVVAAKSASWKPSGATLSYTWKRSGVTIKNATASTYALTESDVGRTITVTTTAKASKFISASRTSLPTAVVKSKLPAKVGAGVALKSGDELVSTNGRYSLEQRSSGSLVLADRLSGKVLWVNGAKGKASYTILTAKGSLASYSAKDKLIWSSKTTNKGVSEVAVTTDGKLRLRTPAAKTIWSRN